MKDLIKFERDKGSLISGLTIIYNDGSIISLPKSNNSLQDSLFIEGHIVSTTKLERLLMKLHFLPRAEWRIVDDSKKPVVGFEVGISQE